jgi:hypothetical protein
MKRTKQVKGTYQLKSIDEQASQNIEKTQVIEGHSLPREHE